jgi:hypothetical protein
MVGSTSAARPMHNQIRLGIIRTMPGAEAASAVVIDSRTIA